MGYENTLFNGKSMRNAIITKLSEDKHLTSALFANSNITILIDIVSYMYQCLMSNLRQAASESMWSDTMFFENAARLAKLIGYYAKGQMPFTMLGRLSTTDPDNNSITMGDYGQVNFTYGPYDYTFSIVEKNNDNNDNVVKLALGEWKEYPAFDSDGSKFQEFIIENKDEGAFISQKYIKVFTTDANGTSNKIDWTYTPTPLFILLNEGYTSLNDPGLSDTSRSIVVNSLDPKTRLYNFYINENGDYVLKFGDGISTAIPPSGSQIHVRYIQSTETDKTITQSVKSAIINASAAEVTYAFEQPQSNGESGNILCTPITMLSGYKDKETADTIRKNSKNAFSRQNRLVTKRDYHDYILESYPEWKDVVVQNNWEFISSFYGWLYAIQEKQPEAKSKDGEARSFLNQNNLELFNNPDLADANNIYIWVLEKLSVDPSTINQSDEEAVSVGRMYDKENGGEFATNIGALKDITVNPVFLHAVCKRFAPSALSLEELNSSKVVDYDNKNPFKNYKSYFRVHIDPNYANNLNAIQLKTYEYIKSYLFDNLTLGYTPNIPALIKDLMSIDGVMNITTVFNSEKDNNIKTEQETNGMKFCTWTDTNNTFVFASEDVDVSYNLPNIPCFQYFRSSQSYNEFINNSIEFKIDS